jgi:hypothetical protein
MGPGAKGGGCSFLHKFKQQKPMGYASYGFPLEIWDIEDLIVSFKKKRV